jgi:hypothetical protein
MVENSPISEAIVIMPDQLRRRRSKSKMLNPNVRLIDVLGHKKRSSLKTKRMGQKSRIDFVRLVLIIRI